MQNAVINHFNVEKGFGFVKVGDKTHYFHVSNTYLQLVQRGEKFRLRNVKPLAKGTKVLIGEIQKSRGRTFVNEVVVPLKSEQLYKAVKIVEEVDDTGFVWVDEVHTKQTITKRVFEEVVAIGTKQELEECEALSGLNIVISPLWSNE